MERTRGRGMAAACEGERVCRGGEVLGLGRGGVDGQPHCVISQPPVPPTHPPTHLIDHQQLCLRQLGMMLRLDVLHEWTSIGRAIVREQKSERLLVHGHVAHCSCCWNCRCRRCCTPLPPRWRPSLPSPPSSSTCTVWRCERNTFTRTTALPNAGLVDSTRS